MNLQPGDRVRFVAFSCKDVPRMLVGREAKVIERAERGGGLRVRVLDEKTARYVPGDVVARCLERVAP